MAAKTKARRKAGSDLIDKRVKALGHHTRRKIMAHLTNVGPDSPSKMSKVIGEKLVDVAYHAKRLEDFGCAELVDERSQPGRPPEKIYRATDRYLVDTGDWDKLDPATQEGSVGEWGQLFVDDLVEGIKAGLGSHEQFALIQNRVIVDEQGRARMIEIEERAMQEVQDEQARALGRLSDGEPRIHMSVLQACFEVPQHS